MDGHEHQGAPNRKALAESAVRLAQEHAAQGMGPGSPRSLIGEFTRSGEDLARTYDLLARASAEGAPQSPGVQWILDNFYILRQQRTEVLRHLRSSFFRSLPHLRAGPGAGHPRVFTIADRLVDLVDGAVDRRCLDVFLSAYQRVSPLRLGELWAIPDVLRVSLLLRVKGLASQVRSAHLDRLRATEWARSIGERAQVDPVEGLWEARGLVDEAGDALTDTFVVELVDRLAPFGADARPVAEWLERQLAARSRTLQDLTRLETQRQVSVGNAVASLRWAAEVRWGPLIESVSLIERVLRQDPSGIYPRMDFETRDRYRRAVEELARHSPAGELEVATAVIEAARTALPGEGRHVGHHLLGPGAAQTERALGFRPGLGRRFVRFAYRHPTTVYLGSVGLVTAVALGATLAALSGRGVDPLLLVLGAIAALLPLLDLAVALTNRLVAWLIPPRQLPKMDAERGLDDEHRALVVIPTLIRSVEDALDQVAQLEIHARANPSSLLRFALLTDFPDADRPSKPDDPAILAAARGAIRRLNRSEPDRDGDRFFLLHRRRVWNPAEEAWMGLERKRGKLEELNELLLDPDAQTSYAVIEGRFREMSGAGRVRYVLTLDADTQLPPGAAVDLIRTAAHPLNRPVYDPERRRVVRGYGILQPRVSISPRGTARSWFARIFSGHTGIDPYTTAVSDVYQDLFGEGIYTGKGLYHVEAFATALSGVIPANRVLSHDLLESVFARTALVTDVEVFDDYPSTYLAYSRRSHRWTRGDWQIIRWLGSRFRDATGTVRRNPVSGLGRWLILDNLRRSLTPAAMLIFLLIGWVALPRSPIFWTAVALAVLAFPVYVKLTSAVFARPRDATWRSYVAGVGQDVRLNLVQTGLTIVFLAHDAIVRLDAIARALWRMVVTRRELLEWTTAKDQERSTPGSLVHYVREMSESWLWAGASLLVVTALEPSAWIAALPFVAAWVAAPVVAWRLQRVPSGDADPLTDAHARWLRVRGRRTWLFFDRFVGPDTRWLPPDNVQESPFRGAAPRTSPTNIGLALMSAHVAYDFGWIGQGELLDRLEAAASSIDALERYEGHLFNWYDVRDGRTLWPRYVSTVDSGNFAACVLTLGAALRAGAASRWPNPNLAQGVRDTLDLCGELTRELGGDPGRDRAVPMEVERALARCVRAARGLGAGDAAEWAAGVERLLPLVNALYDEVARALALDAGNADDAIEEPLLPAVAALRRLLEREAADLTVFLPGLGAEDGSRDLHRVDSLVELASALARRAPSDPGATAARAAVGDRLTRSARLAEWCERTFEGIDFTPLYNQKKDLFTIGLDVETLQMDGGHYDLLASEARLASLLAIAKGDAPARHWFLLGRSTTKTPDGTVLLSWSGTLFEYLMPLLWTITWPGTLLDETCRNAVETQRRYGTRRGHPWGVSESAYNTLNLELDYQYRAFGVPGLGLKRGLAREYVVSPYAGALGLMVRPADSTENLERLEREGALGPYGFYESIDYTSDRLAPGRSRAVVATWMAHHQGMILLSLSNALQGGRVQRLFHSIPTVRAAELLLQEKLPRRIEITDPHPLETSVEPPDSDEAPPPTVIYAERARLLEPSPRGHLLSNGRYSTLVTQAGTGYSRFQDWELTRWRPDRTADPDGFFLYLRDLESGDSWSVTPAPTHAPADRVDTWFHLNKVETALVHDWIEAFVEVCVSPEDDVEVRRVTITNYGERTRRLDLTSYVEIVLDQVGAAAAHPAFSKLFIETESIPEHRALLATRRPRREDAPRLWMFHTVAEGVGLGSGGAPLELETDRARFLGRRRSPADPAALDAGAALSGTVGPVLDPAFALRCPLTLKPRERRVFSFVLGVAPDRDAAIRMADRYDHPSAAQRALDLATAHGSVEIQHLQIPGEEALRLQELAAAVLYQDPRLRAHPEILARNRKQQSGLWAYGISGDLPIVVLRVSSLDHLPQAREAMRAFEYWALKGLDVDLVFLNEHPPSYVEGLQEALTREIQMSASRAPQRRGAMWVLRADQIPDEDRVLIESVAHAVFDERITRLRPGAGGADRSQPYVRTRSSAGVAVAPSAEVGSADVGTGERAGVDDPLRWDNGYGGYAEDGSYVVRMPGGQGRPAATPLPWINVVANPVCGFIGSESGGGFTWSLNSRENRLTPWANDPVVDPPSEVVYVRDEDTGRWGSVTPSPAPLPGAYETRHRFGSTTYRHETDAGVRTELTRFVPAADGVVLSRLRVRNGTQAPVRLSVYGMHPWVLGGLRRDAARMVVTERDPESGALLARNAYRAEHARRLAFAYVLAPNPGAVELTADRAAFLGRTRSMDAPFVVEHGQPLDGTVGAGLDPCAAFRVPLEIEPGAEAEVTFLLGEADSLEAVRRTLGRYDEPRRVTAALHEVEAAWRDRLTRVRVRTPSPRIDRLFDGWLIYQAWSCRLWARSALYQSGGAFGFRDQLQDVMALVYHDPAVTRGQILLHAAHQFVEGDVLHWWHPPTGRGIRTRFSDDLLWLPFVTAFYVSSTGDHAILDDRAPFVVARSLEEDEDEAYVHPHRAPVDGDLYEHCCRALDRSLTAGRHGLPLMGSGDWNDGMNRVGTGGEGESVWLGFFLHRILGDFLPLCEARGDAERAARYRTYRGELAEALEDAGWDGAWYRRAYFDDGTPLGSARNPECRIDAIAQAWSVLSGVASPERAHQALSSVDRHLLDRDADLIRLLTPPFHEWEKDPGYIKGYVPGVRENGGQYTHGVLWVVAAWAELGHVDRALELLEMLTPVHHARDRRAADRYRVEPYVAAADVYSVEPHVGRGGWTWYTGSAAWMWRVGLESLLGFRLRGGDIALRTRLPSAWGQAEIEYRPDEGTVYAITIERRESAARATAWLDGEPLDVAQGEVLVPVDLDGRRHEVRVTLPPTAVRSGAREPLGSLAKQLEVAEQPPE